MSDDRPDHDAAPDPHPSADQPHGHDPTGPADEPVPSNEDQAASPPDAGARKIWDPDTGRWVDPNEIPPPPTPSPETPPADQPSDEVGSFAPAPGFAGAPPVRSDAGPPPGTAPAWLVSMVAGVVGAALAVTVLLFFPGFADRGPAPATSDGTSTAAQDTTALVAAVRPSVVSVRVEGPEGTSARSGSGMILTAEGAVATAASLVDGATAVVVTFPDGRAAPAEVVGSDPVTDVAVVRVNGRGLPPILRTSAELARLGEPVAVIGSPAETFASVTTGVVSQIGRPVTFEGSLRLDLLQVDATGAATPGSVVAGMDGSTLAMTTSIQDRSGARYAAPIDVVASVSRQLLAGQPVSHPWIGLVTSASPGGSERTADLVVAVVFRDSPAEQAGLSPGDVVVAVGGRRVVGALSLVAMVQEAGVGAELTLTVRPRDGGEREITLTVADQPEF